ncbi:MAG: hypothetical protein ABI042_17415 [Verrucomicrobiota bacterium]
MARNRKNQSAAIRLVPALNALMLCLFIGGAGVGYVWYKNQLSLLGQQIREREIRLDQLKTQNKASLSQLEKLCSSLELNKQIKKWNLGLAAPPVSQVVHLVETSIEATEISPQKDLSDLRQAQANFWDRGN